MGKGTKIWLLIAALLVIAGLVLFGAVMSAYRWDFTRLATIQYETNTYTIGDDFHNISIRTDTADIVFAPSKDGSCKVVCYEEENVTHAVTIRDGTLTIQLIDERSGYDIAKYIGIHFGSPKITVYLPKSQYESLVVQESTRDICIEGLTVGVLDLTVTTGDVTLNHITCKTLTSTGNTGDMELEHVVAAEEILIERTTGDVELDRCNAGRLSVRIDTGDVEFDRCDAGQIIIQTDTGDVTGSLLSGKNFTVETDTGDVDVPQSTGGLCQITTDTGDITITIASEMPS